MIYTDKEVDFILKQFELAELTEWETGFTNSLRAQRQAGKSLSTKQVETLASIWDKYF